MSGFKLDFGDTFGGFEKIDDGNYEVIIEHAREDATKNGAEFVNVQMVIRNDLDQPFKNNKIWNRIWKTKATGEYNMLMFNTIGKAAKLESGKQYSGLDELLEDFARKPVQVFVQNETSEYNGNTYENLNVKSWKETGFPDSQHQFKGGDKPTGGGSGSSDISVSDDEIPF